MHEYYRRWTGIDIRNKRKAFSDSHSLADETHGGFLDIVDSLGALRITALFFTAASFVFLALVLLYSLHRQTKRIDRAQMQEILTADETLRREFARDLHDDIAQELAAARMLCERAANEENPTLSRERCKAAGLLLGECGKKVRGLSRRLRPPELENGGLLPAIQSLIQLVHQLHGIDIALGTNGDIPRFSLEIETHLYRIIQEALINAIKYAGNHRISVRLTITKPKNPLLRIEVINEGHEPATSTLSTRTSATFGGMGIPGMRDRAALLGARFTLFTGPLRSCVMVELPLVTALRQGLQRGV